jgi:F420-dependent oxidoreductase-like protein
LSLGAKVFVEGAFGLPFERPVGRLREFLAATREIITPGTADHRGDFYTATPPFDTTLAGAEPEIPILVAAMGPQALRVSGELADGILPFLAGPNVLSDEIVPQVSAAATAAGRPAPRVIAFVAAVVTDNPAKGRETAAAAMDFYNNVPSYQRVIEREGASHAADLALIGSAAEVEAGLRRYIDAGATEIVLTQTDLLGREAQRETWNVAGQLSGTPR